MKSFPRHHDTLRRCFPHLSRRLLFTLVVKTNADTNPAVSEKSSSYHIRYSQRHFLRRQISNFLQWLVLDTSATRHVCNDLSLFKNYNETNVLGDHHTTNVVGINEMELKFPSTKTVILKEFMHTPKIRKNIISSYLLNNAGFTQTKGVDLFTLTKNNVFVRTDYSTYGKCSNLTLIQ